jgi:hypothetical protein
MFHPIRALAVVAALCGALASAACGVTSTRSSCTEFPASVGFQPLERDFTDVAWPSPLAGPYASGVAVVYGPSIAHAWAHGRGFVRCPLASVYLALADPAASRIVAPGGHFTDTLGVEPAYPISYNVEYVVHDVLTVRWNILTRGGLLQGTQASDLGARVGLRYQRTCGDDHIALESGSLVATAAQADAAYTQIELVGWLNAATQGPSDVGGTLTDWWRNLSTKLATLNVPGCP